MCMYVTCVGACGGLKRVSDSIELVLQAVLSHLIEMLRTELRSSGRAVCFTGESPLSLNLFLLIIYLCVLPWHTCWGQRTT